LLSISLILEYKFPSQKRETAMTEKKSEDYFAVAPPKRSGWANFKIFLWNGETSEFLGRSASSWGKTKHSFISYYR
jgi:sodium/potassium-transporting ATPase subunit beta